MTPGCWGLGEATHGSHDFSALQNRVFRHLVEENRFCTFALEAPWTTARRLDDYVVHGTGDPRQASARPAALHRGPRPTVPTGRNIEQYLRTPYAQRTRLAGLLDLRTLRSPRAGG
ncbi:erythromycin esterase family protein [Streptomyces sp. NPDC006309]|uniref:erythromycin esterase family protein n=1 Tax=Streptomyces sp. NPDC006309 TaxID=3156749 RepID=UPI0033A3306B